MDVANPNAWGSNWRCRVFFLEETMPKPNLSRMDVESLMNLRDQVDQRLREYHVELQKQLERIALLGGERTARGGRGGGSALRGRKVPPNIVANRGTHGRGREVCAKGTEKTMMRGPMPRNFFENSS